MKVAEVAVGVMLALVRKRPAGLTSRRLPRTLLWVRYAKPYPVGGAKRKLHRRLQRYRSWVASVLEVDEQDLQSPEWHLVLLLAVSAVVSAIYPRLITAPFVWNGWRWGLLERSILREHHQLRRNTTVRALSRRCATTPSTSIASFGGRILRVQFADLIILVSTKPCRNAMFAVLPNTTMFVLYVGWCLVAAPAILGMILDPIMEVTPWISYPIQVLGLVVLSMAIKLGAMLNWEVVQKIMQRTTKTLPFPDRCRPLPPGTLGTTTMRPFMHMPLIQKRNMCGTLPGRDTFTD